MPKADGKRKHHCPKASKGGCSFIKSFCTEHQRLCTIHGWIYLKNEACPKCEERKRREDIKRRAEADKKKEEKPATSTKGRPTTPRRRKSIERNGSIKRTMNTRTMTRYAEYKIEMGETALKLGDPETSIILWNKSLEISDEPISITGQWLFSPLS